MPLDSYVIAHAEAKLSAADKKEVMDYFKFVAKDTRILNEIPNGVEKSDFKIK